MFPILAPRGPDSGAAWTARPLNSPLVPAILVVGHSQDAYLSEVYRHGDGSAPGTGASTAQHDRCLVSEDRTGTEGHIIDTSSPPSRDSQAASDATPLRRAPSLNDPSRPALNDPDRLDDVRFAVIGAGRAGVSIARALSAAGARLVGHTGRSDAGRIRAAELLGVPSSPTLSELVAEMLSDHDGGQRTPSTRGAPTHASGDPAQEAPPAPPPLFLLTVPDAELPSVAAALADAVREAALGGPVWAAVHMSGATSTDVLAPCAAAGAQTFSFHPLQTLSDPVVGPERLRGAAVAMTPGSEVPASAEYVSAYATRLARAIGARPFRLEERDRALYHAAAVVAGNYLITLEAAAERLFLTSGLPQEQILDALLPLVRGAVDNIAASGTLSALTGPLARGDVDTIERHLRALEERTPDLLPLYTTLGAATLDLVRRRDDLPAALLDRLEAIMTVTTERSRQAVTGDLTVLTRTISFSTQGEGDVIDITHHLNQLLRESGLTAGTVTIFAPGATGAVTTLEFEPGVVHDFQQLFARIVPADDPYRHNLLLADGNGHSHVRAGLLGPSLVIPFTEGRLTLGTWQEAVFVCFDSRPRDRRLVAQFMGVTE